jgi:deazaflavin-dependent oxidoreductase (nitroreductase family)
MGLMTDLGVRDRGDSALTRAAKRVVAIPVVTRVLARVLPAVDRVTLRATRGRITPTELVTGLPTVFVTTTGARSGLPRTVPLVAVPVLGGAHDGDLAVIGSNWGGASHPAWVHNITADPRVTVTRGRRSVAALATGLPAEAGEQVWARAAAMYDGYESYRQRAGGRDIRVFVLSTVGEDGRP